MVDPKDKSYKPAGMSASDEPVSAGVTETRTFRAALDRAIIRSKNNNFVISSEFEASADPIRESLKKYWYDYASDIKFLRIPYTSYLEIQQIQKFEGTLLDKITPFIEEVNKFKPVRKTGVEDVSAGTVDPTSQFEIFEILSENISVDDPVEVYNFNCSKPVEYPSRYRSEGKFNYPTMNVSFVYDYELINYEKLLADSSVEEASLLNYYKDYEIIKSAYTFASDFSPTGGPKDGPSITYSKDSKSNFDNEMTKKTREGTRLDTNIIITTAEIENIQSLNKSLDDDKISLPFHIRVDIGRSFPPSIVDELDSNIKKQITQKGYNVFVKVAKYAIDITSAGANPEYFSKRDFNFSYYVPQYKNQEQTEFELKKTISSQNSFLIDALYMTRNIDNGSVVVNSNSPEATIIGNSKEKTISYLEDEIESLIRDEKLQNEYIDVVNGTAEFYETDTIFYKISKYDASDLENPLQNIYIPNVDGKSISYIDFQVKYGKRYVYKVSTFKFISGLEYVLNVTEPTDDSSFAAEINEYYKRLNNISVETSYRIFAKAKVTNDYGFWESITAYRTDLNEVFLTSGSDKISPREENMTSLKRDSFGLRAAISAMSNYLGTISSDRNAGKYLLETVRPRIVNILDEDKEAEEEDKFLTADTRNELINLRNLIFTYYNKMNALLKDARDILADSDGLGSDKATRKEEAQKYLSRIAELIDEEEEILNGLAKVKNSEIDDDISAFNPNIRDVNSLIYPTIKMIEIPYYQDAGSILDSPPLFPDVNFIPYKGNSKNISFFLNSGVGEIIDSPIIIDPAEIDFYTLWRESRKYNDLEPIPFKSDEAGNLAAFFEIYRLKTAPKSYNDFRNALYQTVSENFKGGISNLPSASYLEKIKPNTTYYYMFRQRDRRGALSNPSAVFSVLLVDEGGLVFPIIEKYEFPEEKNNYSTSVKKLINIAPSINQVTPQGLSGDNSYTTYKPGSNVNNIMGVEKEGIFGKSFKIRVTSKKTGKKIDINLTFDAEVV